MIEALAKATASVQGLLVVDEAYAEFVTDPEIVDGRRDAFGITNVAILRTFSKAYGVNNVAVVNKYTNKTSKIRSYKSYYPEIPA